jgi:hypothetical protein
LEKMKKNEKTLDFGRLRVCNPVNLQPAAWIRLNPALRCAAEL